MKIINKIKKELNCDIKKYSFFNNVKYIETDIGNFIIKKTDDNELFINLSRNGFDNYIDYKYAVDDYKLYPHIDNFEIEDDERGLDVIYLMSKLHNKTSYFKEVSLDEIKDMTPTEMYLLPNLSIIFISLDLANKYLEEWYEIMQNKKRIRISLIHNNLDLSHIIENDKPYLISWEHHKYDLPIYDFLHFYKEEFDKLDFIDLLNIYKNNVNASKEELFLLYVEMLMPQKLILNNSEIKNVYDLTKQNQYLIKSYNLVLKDDKPDEKHQKS